MNKINRMISQVRRETLLNAEQMKHKELADVVSRMTTAQLVELVVGEPSDDRIKEILASVGGLTLLKEGE